MAAVRHGQHHGWAQARRIRSNSRACRVCFKPQHVEEHDAERASPSTTPPPMPQAPGSGIKVIGLGARGISSMNRLAGSGHLSAAKFWAIDADRKVLTTASHPSVQSLEVMVGDDITLQPADLAAITGTVDPGLPAGSRPDGAAGVVFVMGSALGSPGGATLMLQLVNHLRRQGHFVAATLTRPFTFEGARKLEQADALIEMMEEVAHLVVVVDQGVLTRASADMTMTMATTIADKTLQYTVRSIVWALSAPEILKVSSGAFLWHGRDLRAMKRPLFPPMMSLLTCPGHAYLGRGQATLPPGNMSEVGLASLLSTLAEDATHAASESPFLDGHMAAATAVLCILIFPRDVVDASAAGRARQGSVGRTLAQSSGTYPDNYREYALRSAVQVAALTVRELAGPNCRDIVVCPQVKEEVDPAPPRTTPPRGTTPDTPEREEVPIVVECALLVIKGSHDSAVAQPATPRGSAAPPSQQQSPGLRLGSWAHAPAARPAAPQQQRGGARPSHSPPQRTPQPTRVAKPTYSQPAPGRSQQTPAPAQPAPAPVRAPAVMPAWQAMSMIAGGSAAAAHNIHGSRRPPARHPAAAQPVQPAQPVDRRPPAGGRLGLDGAGRAPVRPPAAAGMDASAPPSSSTPASRPNTSKAPVQIPRMSGKLVSTLVATSLDLPPQAARWRHELRHTTPMAKPERMYEIQDAATAADGEDGEDEGVRPAGRFASLLRGRSVPSEERDVRTRVAGMLEKERDFS